MRQGLRMQQSNSINVYSPDFKNLPANEQLAELNRAIREKLDAFNDGPFKKKEGSRLSLFLDEDSHYWRRYPLPLMN